MNLKKGDQVKLRPGMTGEQIAQVTNIVGTDKFYNDTGENRFWFKSMKDGDFSLLESEIENDDKIQFYKAKEDREFDVMEKFESPFERAMNNN